jgi:hypothetical protein
VLTIAPTIQTNVTAHQSKLWVKKWAEIERIFDYFVCLYLHKRWRSVKKTSATMAHVSSLTKDVTVASTALRERTNLDVVSEHFEAPFFSKLFELFSPSRTNILILSTPHSLSDCQHSFEHTRLYFDHNIVNLCMYIYHLTGDSLQTLAMRPNSHALTESASIGHCAATVTTTAKTFPTSKIALVNKNFSILSKTLKFTFLMCF